MHACLKRSTSRQCRQAEQPAGLHAMRCCRQLQEAAGSWTGSACLSAAQRVQAAQGGCVVGRPAGGSRMCSTVRRASGSTAQRATRAAQLSSTRLPSLAKASCKLAWLSRAAPPTLAGASCRWPQLSSNRLPSLAKASCRRAWAWQAAGRGVARLVCCTQRLTTSGGNLRG